MSALATAAHSADPSVIGAAMKMKERVAKNDRTFNSIDILPIRKKRGAFSNLWFVDSLGEVAAVPVVSAVGSGTELAKYALNVSGVMSRAPRPEQRPHSRRS